MLLASDQKLRSTCDLGSARPCRGLRAGECRTFSTLGTLRKRYNAKVADECAGPPSEAQMVPTAWRCLGPIFDEFPASTRIVVLWGGRPEAGDGWRHVTAATTT